MAGIRDVAALAGVGVGTVSRALNGTGYVSKETRKKIEEAVNTLNYNPNELARNLFHNRSGMVGVIVPDIENPFFAKFLKCTEIELYKRGYKAVICNTVGISSRMDEMIDMLKKNVLDGLIVGVDPPDGFDYHRLDKPIVSLDRNWGEDVPVITSDNVKGGRMVAEKIISSGGKSVLIFESKTYIQQPFDDRNREVKRILKEHGVKIVGAQIEWNALNYEYYLHIAEEYLTLFDKVDTVYAADLIAVACLGVANKRKIEVPEKLRIIGYDGLNLTNMISPILTTVKQNVPLMSKRCVETFIKMVKGEPILEHINICDVEFQVGGTI